MSYSPEAFVAELRTVLENVQTELSATGRNSARIQRCIDAMPSLAATLRQQAARVDEENPFGGREKEAVQLAAILDGMTEGSYMLETLYEYDQGDGDPFVARAADLLREFAALEAALSAQPAERQGEAVAEIGPYWELRYVGNEPISKIVDRSGLKIGDKLYTHPAAPVGVPDGMVLVPREPTEAMLNTPSPGSTGLKRRMWQLMLAAAPSAPQGEG